MDVDMGNFKMQIYIYTTLIFHTKCCGYCSIHSKPRHRSFTLLLSIYKRRGEEVEA